MPLVSCLRQLVSRLLCRYDRALGVGYLTCDGHLHLPYCPHWHELPRADTAVATSEIARTWTFTVCR